MANLNWIRIEATSGWRLLNLKELQSYRDLFFFLVLRDIKVIYHQTVLGFSWALIRPFLQMIVFTVIFGKMAKVSSDGAPYALFSYVALVPWTYFQTAMTSSTTSLVTSSKMITKVYFPRLVVPLTSVLAKLVDFGISFLLIIGLMIWYQVPPRIEMTVLPLLIFLMIATAAGMGMWLSALTIQYRDIKHATTFLAQFLMYAAPVVWPVSLIAEHYGQTARLVYGLYPMAGIIEGFRSAIIGTSAMPWDLIGMGAFSSTLILVTGAFYFKRMERRFADVA